MLCAIKSGASEQITLIATNLNRIIRTFNHIKHRLFVAYCANYNNIYRIISEIYDNKKKQKVSNMENTVHIDFDMRFELYFLMLNICAKFHDL